MLNNVYTSVWTIQVVCCSPIGRTLIKHMSIPRYLQHTYLHGQLYFNCQQQYNPINDFALTALKRYINKHEYDDDTENSNKTWSVSRPTKFL